MKLRPALKWLGMVTSVDKLKPAITNNSISFFMQRDMNCHTRIPTVFNQFIREYGKCIFQFL